MDPENTITETTAPVAPTTDQPASPPAPEKPSSFSQEDVNRIVAKRLEEDRARRPVAAPPAPKPTQPSKPAAPADVDLRAELDEMRRQQTELVQRLDYTSRASKLGLDEARAAALFKVYQANPDGFDDVVGALGIKASQPAASAAPTVTAATPQPNAAPISDKGSPAPGTGANWNREFADNPLNMSAAAIAQMNAELGKEVATRKRVEASLARGVNIKVTPR
jgi:hypothetical protein